MTKKNTILDSIRRTPFQAVTAFLVTFFSLFLGYIFFFVAVGSYQILHYFETRPQVNAYFKSDHVPSTEEIATAESSLRATGLARSVTFVTKEQALEIYKNLNSSDPLLLEAVTPGMLPASLEVTAASPKDLKQLSELLSTFPNIEEVSYAADVVDSLETWVNSIRLVGSILVGSLLLISFFVMTLVIGLKISAKKNDIHIQQLLGAHSGFIIAPFVKEGFLYGIFSALSSWILACLLLLYSTPFLVKFLSGLPVLPVSWVFLLISLAGGLILGGSIGASAGLIASRRFLKS